MTKFKVYSEKEVEKVSDKIEPILRLIEEDGIVKLVVVDKKGRKVSAGVLLSFVPGRPIQLHNYINTKIEGLILSGHYNQIKAEGINIC